MLNFGGITHIIANPAGHAEGYNYSFVGDVPLSCLEEKTPSTSDIMAGRVYNGKAYKSRKIGTVEEAVNIAREGGARLCESDTCACRKLFTLD